MAWMQRVWQIVLRLTESRMKLHQDFRKLLFFVDWTVFMEVMQIFEANGWDVSCALGIAYVAAMFGQSEGAQSHTNTLWIENFFNALRDNEGRGARHKQRGPVTHMALCISTMATRFAGSNNNLIDIGDEDCARFENYTTHAPCFNAGMAKTTGLGVDAGPITDGKSWPSTKPDSLTNQGPRCV